VHLVRWLATCPCKGAKKTYLNFLNEHYNFQLRVIARVSPPVTPHINQDVLSAAEGQQKVHRRSKSGESTELIVTEAVGRYLSARKAQSMASRPLASRTPLNTILFGDQNSSNNSSKNNTANISAHLAQSNSLKLGNSARLSGNSGMPPYFAKRNTLTKNKSQENNSIDVHSNSDETPVKKEPREILNDLIAQERFVDAIACKKFILAQEEIVRKETEYLQAKNDDELHHAIQIRAEITKLKAVVDATTDTMMQSWSFLPRDHLTRHQMQQF